MAARTKAPKISVKTGWTDQRAAIIDALNKENPEFVHCFQNKEVTQDELVNKDQELVYRDTYSKDDEHEVLKWRNDVVARTPREVFEAQRAAECEQSAMDVQNLYCRPENNDSWKDNSPGRRIASPKDPNQIGNIGGM